MEQQIFDTYQGLRKYNVIGHTITAGFVPSVHDPSNFEPFIIGVGHCPFRVHRLSIEYLPSDSRAHAYIKPISEEPKLHHAFSVGPRNRHLRTFGPRCAIAIYTWLCPSSRFG